MTKIWYRSPAESRLDWNSNPVSPFGKRSIFEPALQFFTHYESSSGIILLGTAADAQEEYFNQTALNDG
jgi:hypothetical protein